MTVDGIIRFINLNTGDIVKIAGRDGFFKITAFNKQTLLMKCTDKHGFWCWCSYHVPIILYRKENGKIIKKSVLAV